MDIHHFLILCIIFLAAAVIAVPLFRFLGLGAVLGYLVAGMVIGPWGLSLVEDVETVLHFSEFGVVLLLFVIGLELQPSRLRVFRANILRAGTMQMALTTLILFLIMFFGFKLTPLVATLIAFSLALSSTAFALQTLAEKKQLTTSYGRQSFAILLFQDLAVIPALAIIPALAGAQELSLAASLPKILINTAAVIVVIIASRFLLNPVLKIIAHSNAREVFTAATLLLVFSAAIIFESFGMSMALGAFLAGVMLADSEYRHALEADIEPFKGILLGLFFMAVGMSVNAGLIMSKPVFIFGLALSLMLIKFGVLQAVGYGARLSQDARFRLALVMPQGGEFAFVLMTVAVASGVIERQLSDLVIAVVSISMLLSPLFYAAFEKLPKRANSMPEADVIEAETRHVIIAGFGRFGQVVARILAVEKIPFTALEKDPQQIKILRKYGNKIYYGDVLRPDLLRAARAGEARAIVLAIDDPEESLHAAGVIRKHFPEIPILARARNRQHALRLLDLNIKIVIRETLESSLLLTEHLLEELGYEETDAIHVVKLFKEHDAELLLRQHAIHNDEQAMIQSISEAREELQRLFDADRNGKN